MEVPIVGRIPQTVWKVHSLFWEAAQSSVCKMKENDRRLSIHSSTEEVTLIRKDRNRQLQGKNVSKQNWNPAGEKHTRSSAALCPSFREGDASFWAPRGLAISASRVQPFIAHAPSLLGLLHSVLFCVCSFPQQTVYIPGRSSILWSQWLLRLPPHSFVVLWAFLQGFWSCYTQSGLVDLSLECWCKLIQATFLELDANGLLVFNDTDTFNNYNTWSPLTLSITLTPHVSKFCVFCSITWCFQVSYKNDEKQSVAPRHLLPQCYAVLKTLLQISYHIAFGFGLT